MSSQNNPITPLDITPDKVITFPQGIPGFESCKRFGLFNQDADGVLFSLQCLDDASVAFTVADPSVFGFRYDMPVPEEFIATLELQASDEVAVAVMVFKSEGGGVHANLTAPLLINMRNQLGVQRAMNNLTVDVTLRGA